MLKPEEGLRQRGAVELSELIGREKLVTLDARGTFENTEVLRR